MTTVPLVPPVRVTWYLVTAVLSVAAFQPTTTEELVALAVTSVGVVGASVSGASAAHGFLASAVTVLSFTVVVPVEMV